MVLVSKGNLIADVLITQKISSDKGTNRIYSLEVDEIVPEIKIQSEMHPDFGSQSSGQSLVHRNYPDDVINKLQQKHKKIKSFLSENLKNASDTDQSADGVRNSIAPEDNFVEVAEPEEAHELQDLEEWIAEASEGKTDRDPWGYSIWDDDPELEEHWTGLKNAAERREYLENLYAEDLEEARRSDRRENDFARNEAYEEAFENIESKISDVLEECGFFVDQTKTNSSGNSFYIRIEADENYYTLRFSDHKQPANGSYRTSNFLESSGIGGGREIADVDTVLTDGRFDLSQAFDFIRKLKQQETDNSPENETALFGNKEKSQKVISVLRKIANGSEEETIPRLRNDLVQYGGTNDITFYWGNEKKGIYHIAYRRGFNTLLHVIDAVADGKILRFVEGNKTVILEKNGFEAVLALTEYGNAKSWLLSGWQTNKPDASGEVGTQSTATQLKPTFSRQELGAGIDNIIQNTENASNDSMDELRFALAEYSLDEQHDIVKILKPFTGEYALLKDEEYQEYLKEYGVDVPAKDAWYFAQEAARENQADARRRRERQRNDWLYENILEYQWAVDFAGSSDFKIRVSPRFENIERSGTFWATKKDKKANVIGLDELARHVADEYSFDKSNVEEKIFEFYKDLNKRSLYRNYTEWKEENRPEAGSIFKSLLIILKRRLTEKEASTKKQRKVFTNF